MNDVIENCTIEGKIILNGINIYNPEVDIVKLRTNIGMVFQKPNPFPKSIYDNIIYAPKLHGLVNNKSDIKQLQKGTLTVPSFIRYIFSGESPLENIEQSVYVHKKP